MRCLIVYHWATSLKSGVQFPKGAMKVFFPPPGPNRFWGPPSLLSSGYSELFSLAATWSWPHISIQCRG